MDANQVKSRMEACTTQAAWDRECDNIRRECGGQYPACWYDVVMASGLSDRKATELKHELGFTAL